MPQKPLSDEVLRHTAEVHARNNRSVKLTSIELDIGQATIGHRLRLWERRRSARGEVGGPPIPEIAKPPEGFIVAKNSGAYDADGNLLRQFVQTKRDAGEPYEIPAGHVVKGESAFIDPDGRVLAKWIKTREDGAGLSIQAVEEALERFDGKVPLVARPVLSEDDLLTAYTLPDLHLGMYAWRPESGENYDVEIAAKTVDDAVATLVAQSRPSRRAVLLGMGDYFHANGARAATPASGHQLDVDGRWMKVQVAGTELALRLVDRLARKHDEVEVVFLPGNHDPDSAVALTVAVAMAYRKTKRITVNMSPAIAWYRRFGRVLIGATHGHTMKPDRMAMMLAADRPEDWGKATHRHFFFGHVHHESAKEVGGVRVESFTTPAAKDAYAASGGWRSSRAMSAVTFHSELGEIGRHRVGISAPRPRIRVRAA